MKKIITAIIITATICATACSESDLQIETSTDTQFTTSATTQVNTTQDTEPTTIVSTQSETTPQTQPFTTTVIQSTTTSSPAKIDIPKKSEYLVFEEALTEYTTDVVVAKYVSQKPFGKDSIEYEFSVIDRVLGNAPDKIYVYASDESGYNLEGLFTDSNYLLALEYIWYPGSLVNEDGYLFNQGLVIDLKTPSRSKMAGGALARRSARLDFNNNNLKKETIISYVKELTKNNTPKREFIKSERIEDIVNNSENVLIVEVLEKGKFLSDGMSDWATTDKYYCTVIETIKGNISVNSNVFMVFFADTVKPGEQYIIAIQPVEEGSNMYNLTSKKSLFKMEQLDEIMRIIENG
ncbi:MAG: hypothetical protein LBB56_07050 [Chitinispirillales bacterium]|jgi:hypothetical protein|nr:hypothetical protein [Chitinispirillales bacterium]